MALGKPRTQPAPTTVAPAPELTSQKGISPRADRAIDEVIGRGGSAVKGTPPKTAQVKHFTVKVKASTLKDVDALRDQRPKKWASPKMGISLQDWVLEAILEKIEREQRKYNLPGS